MKRGTFVAPDGRDNVTIDPPELAAQFGTRAYATESVNKK